MKISSMASIEKLLTPTLLSPDIMPLSKQRNRSPSRDPPAQEVGEWTTVSSSGGGGLIQV